MAKTTARPCVVIGLLGSVLDAGDDEDRFARWRPTVALCQQPALPVARLELLHQTRHNAVAARVLGDLARLSPGTAARGWPLPIDDPWDFEQVYAQLFAFARGYPFRPDDEDYLVHITTGTHVQQICLFLLTESRHLPARLVQSVPPPDGAKKGPQSARGSFAVIDLDLSRYDALAQRFAQERREGRAVLTSGIATRNAAFNQLIAQVEHVALRSRAPLLLTGPTGAGKSLLARRVFELRKQRGLVRGELVEVNCATLRGDAAMSALFGHVKGAFTGADRDRPGLLRKADGAMLFLDEIGELGLDEQAMLLRALEDKRFLPVGADREVASDFALVAGTNRDLAARVAQGRFREDLLARIDLWTFRLPGLRERREDIAPNLEYELAQCARTLGVRASISREARARFLAFAEGPSASWPANFRDLNAAVTRMATLAPGGRIDVATVDAEVARLRAAWAPRETPATTPGAVGQGPTEATRATAGDGDESDLVARVMGPARAATLDRFDRVQLAEVLRVCREATTLSAAGRALFARSRAGRARVNDADRLRKYLLRFGLDWRAVTARASEVAV